MAHQPCKKQKITALAEKYAHPRGHLHSILRHIVPFKSGLTPLDAGPFLTVEEEANYQALKSYQRRRFYGFTGAELYSLDCLAPLILKSGEVSLRDVPIHPLYEKIRWDPPLMRHLGRFPLCKGRLGYWEVANPIVWAALEPALRLTSQFLATAHSWPWWDALMAGRYESIHADCFPDGENNRKFAKFQLRNVEDYRKETARQQLQEFFKNSAGRVDIQFSSGLVLHRSGLPGEGFTYGRAIAKICNDGRVMLQIAFELVQPLLRSDLTDAERAMDTFRLAGTLLHETAHVMWADQLSQLHPTLDDEPYFEDEILTELGFSLENTIFGGVAKGFVEGASDIGEDGLPVAGIFQIPWNTVMYDQYNKSPALNPKPPNYDILDIAPIEAEYFMDLYKSEFWSHHVRRFGQEGTRMGTKLIANRIQRDAQSKFTINPYLYPYSDRDIDPLVIDYTWMQPEEIGAAIIENQRRERAHRISAQILKLTEDLKAIEKAQANATLAQTEIGNEEKEVLRGRGFTCPRYNEIQDYLLRNRFELALDTMVTPMPENTLFRYVMDRGGLDISADEFRDFLLVCSFKNNLFALRHNPTFPRRLASPQNPASRTPAPSSNQPTKEQMICFKLVSKEIIRHPSIFQDGFMDHDLEDFKKKWNQWYRAHKEHHVLSKLGRKLKEFSASLWYNCSWYCDREGDMLLFGPEGIIRWTGNIPGIYGKAKKAFVPEVKKVDKSIEDRCRPM